MKITFFILNFTLCDSHNAITFLVALRVLVSSRQNFLYTHLATKNTKTQRSTKNISSLAIRQTLACVHSTYAYTTNVVTYNTSA